MNAEIKMVAADETKWVAWGSCTVNKIFGYNAQAEVRYIMLFEQPAAAITNGDIPAVAAMECAAESYFVWTEGFMELNFKELSIAISSTQDSYTALTNTGLDLTAVVESNTLVTSATTLVGDLTTGVNSRQIWTNANGPKRLLRLDIKNNNAASMWPVVRASDSILSQDSTVKILPLVPTTETKTYSFGLHGYSPYRKDGDGTVHDGCTVHMNNSGAYATDFYPGADFNIRAIYE